MEWEGLEEFRVRQRTKHSGSSQHLHKIVLACRLSHITSGSKPCWGLRSGMCNTPDPAKALGTNQDKLSDPPNIKCASHCCILPPSTATNQVAVGPMAHSWRVERSQPSRLSLIKTCVRLLPHHERIYAVEVIWCWRGGSEATRRS